MTPPAFTNSLTLDVGNDDPTQPILCPPTRIERISALEVAATPLVTIPVREVGWRVWLAVRIAALFSRAKPAPVATPADERAWAERRLIAASERMVDVGIAYAHNYSPEMRRSYLAASMEHEFAVQSLRAARRAR